MVNGKSHLRGGNMNTESLKKAIAVTTRDKIKIYEEFEEKRAIIIELLKPFIRTELQNTIDNEIKEFPDHTRELGLEKLKNMKEDLKILLFNANAMTTDLLSEDTYWLHVDYEIDVNNDRQKYQNKRLAKELIITGIKFLIGKAGEILINYGYERVGASYSMNSKWQLNDNGDIVYGANYGLIIPNNIDDLINSYSNDIERLHEIIYKLMYLTKELEQQEAIELWKEV